MKILEIGGGHLPKAHLVPQWKVEGLVIETLDADPKHKPTYLCDAKEIPEELFGQFDGVLASHVLEHFGYWETIEVLEHWGQALKDGGELHVVVPSLEWAARGVFAERLPAGLFQHMFGGHDTEWNGHKAMFTMRLLRIYMEQAGFGVVNALTGKYGIAVQDIEGNTHEVPAEEHYIVGRKLPKTVVESE